MLSILDRATLVLAEAWRLLPPIKEEAHITDVVLRDLGAVHGLYTPSSGEIVLSARLFWGSTATDIDCIDIHGNDPPQVTPNIGRAVHTALHEAFHAILYAEGLDDSTEWLKLSGWVKAQDDPLGTQRYVETRPGWTQGPSEWRHDASAYFVREYASRSPYEDAADFATWLALGWTAGITDANGLAKVRWLRRHLWEETGVHHLQASARRWQTKMQRVMEAARTPEEQRKRKQRETEAVLFALLYAWLDAWYADAREALESGAPIPDMEKQQEAMIQGMTGPLLRLYALTWRQATGEDVPAEVTEQVQDALTHAVETFIATTQKHLATLPPGEAAALAALALVYAHAKETRLPMLVEGMTHRTTQAALTDAARAQGAVRATWHTTSARPCAFCLSLEGQSFALDRPFFELGETLTSSAGHEFTIGYEDIWHPPLHISCRCTLEYHYD